MKSVKAEVMWMGGDRIDGYYYVGIKGTDLRACEQGHPDFPVRFKEFSRPNRTEVKKDAQKHADETNKQLRKIGT